MRGDTVDIYCGIVFVQFREGIRSRMLACFLSASFLFLFRIPL